MFDPCSMRTQIKTDLQVVDPFGTPTLRNIFLSGVAYNQSCSQTVFNSYFRRFPQYSADIPINQMTMALKGPSNVSQFDYAISPRNKPASWMIRDPSTNENMFCCNFDYLNYPACSQPQPSCAKSCVAGLVVFFITSMVVLGFSLAFFLKRCPAVVTHRAQSAVVPCLDNDRDSHTSATEPMSAQVAGAALSDAEPTASNDDGHSGDGPAPLLELGTAALFRSCVPAVESASPRGGGAGCGGSEEVAARGPTRRGGAAAQVCGPAEDAGGPVALATLDQLEVGGSESSIGLTEREALLVRRINELEKRLKLVSP